MSELAHAALSRREWLERISGPALLASVGTGFVVGSARGAESPSAANVALGARIYSITDFGAKGDGTTLNTDAVQAAIDACAADQGGIVVVPAGDFVVGTIELKSNVTLHLAAHGRLLGSG